MSRWWTFGSEMRQVTAQMEEGKLNFIGVNLTFVYWRSMETEPPSILSGCWNSSMAGSGPGAWRDAAL